MTLLKKLWWFLIIVSATWLGVRVVVDNLDPVAFNLFGFETMMLPSGLWLVITFAVGFIIALIAISPALVRLNHRVKRLNKQLIKIKASTEKNTDAVKID